MIQNKNQIRKDCKSKNNELMDNAKDTMSLGIMSMAGMGAMGAMSSIPGMPAQASTVAGIAGSGLALANVGQLAKTGMSLTNTLSGQSSQQTQQPVKKTVKKDTKPKQSSKSDDVINKILYG